MTISTTEFLPRLGDPGGMLPWSKLLVDRLNRRLYDISIEVNGLMAASGEANTASNVGVGGVGFFDAKVGVDLRFRNLNVATGGISVALDAGNKEVDLSLDPDLVAIAALASTGIACRTAADTWAQRTITGGTGITITNPGGVAGNIDVSLALGSIDHNSLLNLAVGDVHTHYAKLAGRAGGQVLKGGTGTTDTLDLRASDAANYTGAVQIGRGSLSLGDTEFNALTFFADGITKNFTGTHLRAVLSNGAITASAALGGQVNLFADVNTLTGPSSGALGAPVTFSFYANPTIRPGANTQTSLGCSGLYFSPVIQANGFTGHTLSNTYAVNTAGSVASGCTVTTWAGMAVGNPTNSGTITTLVGVDIAALTAGSTDLSIRSAGTTTEMRHAGPGIMGVSATGPDTTGGAILELERVHTLSANINDGYAASLRLDPGYTGAFTVTRHNYLDLQNVSVAASAVVTDAAVMGFDAAIGTHKALASNGTVATTLGSVGPTGAGTTVAGWMKINVNGTLRYIPFW